MSIRRQGIYFSMITLALSQLLYFIYLQTPFTHGEDGIQGIPQGRLFGFLDLSRPTTLYYVVLVGFLAAFLLIYRTINSPFGEVLKSIRENEQRAISLGYKTDQYKFVAFVLSGTLAGFAGSLKVFVAQNASLTDVHWSMSGEIVLMTLVGGLGTVFGPVVGAFIIIAMQQYLAGFGQWVTVIQGVIFVACVLLFRRGIVGEIAHLLQAIALKRAFFARSHASSFRGDALASNPEPRDKGKELCPLARDSGFSPGGLPRNDGVWKTPTALSFRYSI